MDPPGARGALGLAVCFFLSGLGSLVLEVVWTRQLRLMLGSTTLAASTILVAYMLGLGLGGLAGGRVASRLRDGVRAYGWIEIAIGAYALLVPWLFALMPTINRELLSELSFWPAALCRFAIALTVLLLPTVLMGATLPILITAITSRDPRIGRGTGLLYGLNTLGAVAGVFLTTFVLFPTLGLLRTNLFGALLDVGVGLLALLWVSRRVAPAATHATSSLATPAQDEAVPPAAPALPLALILVTYAGVGFTALVYEVAWTRALATVFGSSIFAFATMLGAFLVGIALGSLLARRHIDAIARPERLLAFGLIALGAFGLAATLAIPHLPELVLSLSRPGTWTGERTTLVQVAVCTAMMLPATLVLGALFPLVTRIVAGWTTNVGRAVGRVYFANTLGSASGAFAAGFLLVPTLGLRDTLALAAAINLAGAALLLGADRRTEPRRRAIAALPLAAAVALLIVPIPFDRETLTYGVFRRSAADLDFGIQTLPLEGTASNEMIYYRDGLNSTVSVHRVRGTLSLKVNGKADASSGNDMPTQVLLGEIPLLFGPRPRRVLVIGYASGVTVGSVARHAEVERIDAVEIEPAMIEASRFFEKFSGAPLADPRVHLIIDDGRTHLSATREKYDVIISEPSNPWMSGVSNLFTREFFAAARGALAPRGRLMQWVHLYGMRPADLASILAALTAEFPHVYAFAHEAQHGDLFLLAMLTPLRRGDLPRWENLSEPVREDLRRVSIFSTPDLLSLMRLVPANITALARRADEPNTDDNLHIELRTPALINDQETTAENWTVFEKFPQGVLPLLRQAGEPLDSKAIGALAMSYAARREDMSVTRELLRAAAPGGVAGTSVAAAVVFARRLDQSGTLTNESELASLDRAVALAPDSADVRLARGAVRLEGGKAEEALADADAVLAARPDEIRGHALRANALSRLGRFAAARDEYTRLFATTYPQSDKELWQSAAIADLEAGHVDDAITRLEENLPHDPSWIEGWSVLARAYAERGDARGEQRARGNYDLSRKNVALELQRSGRMALWKGEPDQARDFLEAAAQVDPENSSVGIDLARLE